MKSHRSLVLLLTLLVVTPFTSAAQAAVAVLERLAGKPTIYEVGASGARTVSLPRQGAEYTLPIEIETGATDSATFRLPDSEVSVAPNTVMRVAAPEPSEGGLLQRIFQKAGASLFSVDRRNVEHFQVETPYLVSVVKGTTFNVVVHDEGATVALHEGRLEVNSVDGDDRIILLPGDVAFSGRDGVLEKLEHTMAYTISAVDDTRAPATAAEPLDDALTDDLADEVAALQDALPDDVTASVDVGAGTDLGDDFSADLGDVTGDLADDTGDLLGDLDTGDLADDLGDDLGDGLADDLGDDLADDLGDADDLVADLGNTADDLVDDLGDTAGELVDDLGDTAGDLVDDLGDSAGDLIADLGDTTDELADDLGELSGDLGDDLGDALAGDLGDLTQDLTGAGGDLAGGDLTQDLGDDLGDLGDDLGDLDDDLGDLDDDDGVLGGTLGGILGGGVTL